ncbi:hypothetical protein F4779DRAFT_114882 [Xylariaceae sp. FL0662B]|nr:hypothetical protein F4779DRAFT_114882 [Xylariaceae sp. FL0662B]
MVIRTHSLNSLKRGLLSQIHQPLPLDRRESQKLLESITASFRKNLDNEHPWQLNETPTTTSGQDTSSTTPSNQTRNHRPTDSHLRAILSNPLFAHQHDEKSSSPIGTRNPFDVFDSAVSKGLMTPRRAAGFLISVRSQISAESPDDIRREMAKSGAGLRVVQWLRASGLETSLLFLTDTVLIQKLVPFMYAEGLEEIVWTWLERLAARSDSLEFEKNTGKLNGQSLSHLLFATIKESSESGHGSQPCLDGSYSAMIRANQILPPVDPVARAILRTVWRSLSWASTVEGWERPKPSAPLFDSFVDIGRPFKFLIDMAHLQLHHPLTPSHDAALKYMHSKADSEDKTPSINSNPRFQSRLVFLALDTADRLKQVGHTDEASWVERFLIGLCSSLNHKEFNIPSVGDTLHPNYRFAI